MPAVLRELAPLLHGDALTVTGRALADEFAAARTLDAGVVGTLEAPFAAQGAIAVVRGSSAPDGAVVKRSAASPELLHHRGPAVVFADIGDLSAADRRPRPRRQRRVGAGAAQCRASGAPGMPEWGMLPIPAKLLRAGVTDMVRISDARMSGTAFGTVVLHVAPEAAAGGPLAIVRDGDPIVLDVEARRVDLDLPESEIARRLAARGPVRPPLPARLRADVLRARAAGRPGL